MNRSVLAIMLATIFALPTFAQNEDILRGFFEGRSVVVKMDMPATKDGVDVYPGDSQPIDYKAYSQRIKAAGISLRTGDSVMITLVKVKKKNIEFQLGGGGYGTMGDDTSTSVYVPLSTKSQREKDLEDAISHETDYNKKRQMQAELDDLRRRRERDDTIARALAADAEQKKKDSIRSQAAQSGSRFNIWYDPVVPPEALTPKAVMATMASYVDFPPNVFGGAQPAHEPAPAPAPSQADACATELYKGMSPVDVAALLGRPDRTDEKMEGALKIISWSFFRDRYTIDVRFADNVLISFSINSR